MDTTFEKYTGKISTPFTRSTNVSNVKSFPTGGMSKAVQSQAPKATAQPTAQAKPTTTKVSPTKTAPSKQVKKEKSPEEKYQEDVRKQIENAYNAQVNFLAGQEASLQAQLPTFLQTVATPFEQQLPTLQAQLAEQQARGTTEQENLRMQEQQALAQTRRSAEEAGLRAVQQFGGVAGSSAAQAAGELIGREQLRQAGAVTQQRAAGVQNINDQLRAIQSDYNAQVANLNLQKQNALNNARLEFQKQIDSIRREKMGAGVTKAQMTIEALGQFAARRRQIEDQIAQQQANLNSIREAAALNAQNISLQQSLTPQGITQLPFGVTNFFSQSNQSPELAKILQAGLAAGNLRPMGRTAEGIDLFIDNQGNIVDIRGNKYQ